MISRGSFPYSFTGQSDSAVVCQVSESTLMKIKRQHADDPAVEQHTLGAALTQRLFALRVLNRGASTSKGYF